MGLQHWQMKRNGLFLVLTVGEAAVLLITPLRLTGQDELSMLVIFSLSPRQITLKIVTQLYEGQYSPIYELQWFQIIWPK